MLTDGSGRLSASGHITQNADPFGEGNKFRQGLDLDLLHHPMAMSLNGTLGHAELMGDALVCLASNDEVENLALARRQ
jgi:hypothetical protein